MPQKKMPVKKVNNGAHGVVASAKKRPDGKNKAVAPKKTYIKKSPPVKTAKNTRQANTKPSAGVKQSQGQAIRRTISYQTPQQRQTQHHNKKITGSVKNMEVRSHIRSDKKQFATVKKKKRLDLSDILARVFVFLVIFVILLGLVALIFISKIKNTSSNAPTYTVTIGSDDSDDEYIYSSNGDISGANGSLYICMDSLSDICQLTVTGDNDTRRYIPRESTGQTVSFSIGSDEAVVNGVTVRLCAPTFKYGGNLYVPVSFFEDYVNGVKIEIDSLAHTINFTRENTYSAEVTKSTKGYQPITFKIAECPVISNITEESIDEE